MTQVDEISENVRNLAEMFADLKTTPSDPLKTISDKCIVVLEELRTLQILTESHSEGLAEQLNVVESSIREMDGVFERIDKFSEVLRQAKSNIEKLEKFYNVVERQ